jgi:antitoxin HicB
MDYPIKLTRDDNDTVLVDFPDFPEAHTFGTDATDATRRAVDALATVIDAYVRDRRPIPAPSAGRVRLAVPALLETKIRLYQTMQALRVSKAELARRLSWHQPQVDRLLAMTHGSQLEKIEAAFSALGKRLGVHVEDVAIGRPARRARPVFGKRPAAARYRAEPKRKRA